MQPATNLIHVEYDILTLTLTPDLNLALALTLALDDRGKVSSSVITCSALCARATARTIVLA